MSTHPIRIGYVLKMYPRFSETFVVSEILAREARGDDIHIYSLRAPVDPRFHAQLAQVQAPVRYIAQPRKTEDFWTVVRTALPVLPRLPQVLHDLVSADADDAIQAIGLSVLAVDAGITHLHAHFASVATTVARLASLLTGIPYSFTAHAKDIFHQSVNTEQLALNIRDAHHVVTISDYNHHYLRTVFPDEVGQTVLHRIYNGLDLASFPFSSRSTRLPRTTPVVISVGRLVEKKGLDVLVDAAAHLRQRGRRVAVVIVGEGEKRRALTDHIERLNLGSVVTLTGPMPQDDVRRMIADADIMAVPCVVGSDGNADGLPTVLLEAMSLGTPCISTDVTGITEAVRHERTGLQVAQHDALGLADAICRLLDNRQEAQALAVSARTLIETHFDSRIQAESLHEALRLESMIGAS